MPDFQRVGERRKGWRSVTENQAERRFSGRGFNATAKAVLFNNFMMNNFIGGWERKRIKNTKKNNGSPKRPLEIMVQGYTFGAT
jgi:hypothetical protein